MQESILSNDVIHQKKLVCILRIYIWYVCICTLYLHIDDIPSNQKFMYHPAIHGANQWWDKSVGHWSLTHPCTLKRRTCHFSVKDLSTLGAWMRHIKASWKDGSRAVSMIGGTQLALATKIALWSCNLLCFTVSPFWLARVLFWLILPPSKGAFSLTYVSAWWPPNRPFQTFLRSSCPWWCLFHGWHWHEWHAHATLDVESSSTSALANPFALTLDHRVCAPAKCGRNQGTQQIQ